MTTEYSFHLWETRWGAALSIAGSDFDLVLPKIPVFFSSEWHNCEKYEKFPAFSPSRSNRRGYSL